MIVSPGYSVVSNCYRHEALDFGWRSYTHRQTGEFRMPVDKVKYAYVVVEDMDASVSFYRDALGLKLKFQDGQRWAEFDAGNGSSIALASAEESGLGIPGPVIVFQATEAETLLGNLVAAGAEVIGRRDMGNHGRLVAIREPSGGVFQIFEKAAGPA
jgi:predicted enzyme related to lactoylglutathione lyase